MNRNAPTESKRLAVFCLMVIGFSAGCSERLYTEYGHSHSWLGRKSINGTAALREMYVRRGWETKQLNRLGYQAGQVDAIVWFPAVGQAPKGTTTQWFEDWLADRPRTLVFVCRGHDNVAQEYWRRAARQAPPKDRLEYRRRAARIETTWSFMGFSDKDEVWSNGWFTMESRAKHSETDQLAGPWSHEIVEPRKATRTRVVIRPFDASKDGALETGPRIEGEFDPEEQKTEFEPLLVSAKGEALATRITSDRWPRSQVIAVSSAQHLVNFAMIEANNRAIADRLVAETRPQGAVGFMRTDWAGARVVDADEKPLAAGMELLTTWPLSMTTMHAVLTGFVVCLILLPIFGRPRRLPSRPTGDFSAHVTAFADLMSRSGDEVYARERISEYFTRVREDVDSRWVITKPAIVPAPVDELAEDDTTVEAPEEILPHQERQP